MNQSILLMGIAIASLLLPSIGFTPSQNHELAVAAPVQISKANKRTPFYSKAGRFSIDFPEQPTISTDKIEDGITIYSFLLSSEKGFYQVGYYDIPQLQNLTREEIRKVISGVVRSYLKGFRAKLINTKNIQMGRNLGEEFQFTVSNQISNQNGLGRVYVVGNRFYIISTVVSSPPVAVSFLDSFRLR